MVKKYFSVLIALLLAVAVNAQKGNGSQRFSPEKFDAELHKFIIHEAGLTQQEADAFFPVYKEMQQKQRKLFFQQKRLGNEKPADEAGCKTAVLERDRIDVELKQIQQNYHKKFLEIISASKVYDVLKAEDKFHRMQLRQWGHRPNPEQKKRD
jgi:hypothetical protein